MTVFVRQFNNGYLFAARETPRRLLLVLPEPTDASEIPFEQAWSSRGSFVHATAGVEVDEESATRFVTVIRARVSASGAPRAVMWLTDPDAWRTGPLDDHNTPLLGMDETGTSVQNGLDATMVSGTQLVVANGASLRREGTDIVVRGDTGFDGPRAPKAAQPAASALLAFDGAALGTLRFRIYLRRQSLLDDASWGFQFLYPDEDPTRPPVQEWLPLAAGSPVAALGFDVVIDPCDPLNRLAGVGPRHVRSSLVFTGRDLDGTPTTLQSRFRTARGTGVGLVPVAGATEAHPAALVFNRGVPGSPAGQESQLAPMGDFTLTVAGDPGSADLLCGLDGTELIMFSPRGAERAGDRLRFTPYQPAYAPRFPFPGVSPVRPPVDVTAPLLEPTCLTSWATVVAGATDTPPRYAAQPRGATLYGQGNPVWDRHTGLMGWRAEADLLPPDVSFPLAPYSGLATGVGAFASETTQAFEREVIGPTRSRLIGTRVPGQVTPKPPYTVTTPSGLVVTVVDGRWTKVLLANSPEPPLELAFLNPSPALKQALQTGQLLMVAANATELGTGMPGSASDGSGGDEQADAVFHNTVRIGGWTLSANVGTRNRYGDYRNILIVKGRGGALYNPRNPSASLVADPARWTDSERFAAPTDLVTNLDPPPTEVLAAPDQAELVLLSQWLQDYFDKARRTGGPELARFNAIAADPDWTGVLVLRADITGVPNDLVGITAGVADPDRFTAHHLGIDLTPLANGPTGPRSDGVSAMFGLIDYVDPLFTPPEPHKPARPVPSAVPTPYDFRLLSLQVSFANGAVRSFTSYAQLITTSWFGMSVDHMGAGGNPYAAIVLSGSLQANNGQPVYSLTNTADATFFLDDSVVDKVEVVHATMTTRAINGKIGKVSCWFGLSGFLDFRVVRAPDPSGGDGPLVDFDLFSFGSTPGSAPQSRRGLAFADFGLLMTFQPAAPADRDIEPDATQTRFDLSTSTPRPGSLFRQFALEVTGLVTGATDTPPPQLGYAAAVTDARLTGVADGPWWGISYRLPLGTPGALAGNVGLTAQLLTAWAPGPGGPENGYRAMVGVLLPGAAGGAKLISLQTVLKLSLGQVVLTMDQAKGAFMLLFTEIALKVFGLLSVPPGNTLFYLFGDPAGAGSPSGLGWYAMYTKELAES